jgi:hypothetical protein
MVLAISFVHPVDDGAVTLGVDIDWRSNVRAIDQIG